MGAAFHHKIRPCFSRLRGKMDMKSARPWLAVVFPALFLGQALFAEVDWIPTLREAMRLARLREQLIVLDVSADWCPPCQKMARKVHPDPDFQDFTRTQVFMLVDAYKDPEGVKLAKRFNVRYFPTILVLTADGKEVERFTGGRTTKQLIDDLQLIFNDPISYKELNRQRAEPASREAGR